MIISGLLSSFIPILLSEGDAGSIFSNYKKLIRIKKWFMIEFIFQYYYLRATWDRFFDNNFGETIYFRNLANYNEMKAFCNENCYYHKFFFQPNACCNLFLRFQSHNWVQSHNKKFNFGSFFVKR